jgi:hypothetical protein
VFAHGCNLPLSLRPHDRQIALGARGCLFGRYEIKGRAQHLAQELIRPVALALEIRSVSSSGGFDFGQLALQRFDVGLQISVRSTTTKGFSIVCLLP